MATYHKNLKYHEDTVKKHSITEEELDFLIRLQKEMNTQDTVSQADPRFWVIKGSEEKIAAGMGWDECRLIDENTGDIIARSMQELRDYMKDFLFGEIEDSIPECHELEIKFSEIDDEITLKWRDGYGDLDSVDFDTMEEAAEWLDNEGIASFYVDYIEKRDKIYKDTMFLTQKEAENHLRANSYNYSEDAHTYAMTAWRAPDVEKLWKILQEVDWKSLQEKGLVPKKDRMD